MLPASFFSQRFNQSKNISFENFKETFKKLPPSVTTIAYGIGTISLCPDLFDILNYTRSHGIIPTITINGFATNEELDKLSSVVGACAVSIYNKNKSLLLFTLRLYFIYQTNL